MKTLTCGTVPANWLGRKDGNWEAGYLTAVRNTCPSGPSGYTANDLDLCIRTFDPKGDQTGRFFLVEFKHSSATLTGSQRKLFGMMDRMLRSGDCELYECGRYQGFFLIQFDEDCWNLTCPELSGPSHGYRVNGASISLEDVLAFLCGSLTIEPEPILKEPKQYGWDDLRS